MKTEFLTTLSHELRTPLNAILGWVQLLRDDQDSHDLPQALEVIDRNVRAQAQMIEDLLDMGRIDAGKTRLDLQRVDLPTVVGGSIETARPAAKAKGIRLTSAFANLHGIVMADKDRLQQIVWNLLANAIKFTPRRGSIHVGIQQVDSHVEISVSDTGQGIAPEFLGHVFDRFRQGDATTTRRQGGLGLGLSIVKHLTELHGGTVSAASEGPGKGAVFGVCLPLQPVRYEHEMAAQERRKAQVDAEAAKSDLSGVKVLVVDDEEDSLGIVKRLLEGNGAKVGVATCMQEALDKFRRFSPDLVLSDIGMPEHDGYELIRRLRGLPGGRTVPAVALTALARTEDRTRALQAGFQMHVAKPVDFAELLAVVQNLALFSGDRSKELSESAARKTTG
jgi:CheY-like chemotaxis protein